MVISDWLTVREAMEYLKISKATLFRYVRAGKLKSAKLIGKTLISAESIREALQPTISPTLNQPQ